MLEFLKNRSQGRQAVNFGSFPDEENGRAMGKATPFELQVHHTAAGSHGGGGPTGNEAPSMRRCILLFWPHSKRKRQKEGKVAFDSTELQ